MRKCIWNIETGFPSFSGVFGSKCKISKFGGEFVKSVNLAAIVCKIPELSGYFVKLCQAKIPEHSDVPSDTF